MALLCSASFTLANPLDKSFANPAEATKPWCYWYWLEGNISKEGITEDLENMAAVGIKRAMIGNVTLSKPSPNAVNMMSSEWFDAMHHALKEAYRVGVELAMFNGPGWSQSGGPWIKPKQSMRRVIWNEVESKGGAFKQNIRAEGVPDGGNQDIAVLAVPELDSVSIEGERTKTQYIFSHTEPFTARSISVSGALNGSLFAVRNGKRDLVTKIDIRAGFPKTDFLTNEAQTVSFPDVKAQRFEIDHEPVNKHKRMKKKPAAARVVLSSDPKVAQVLNKQMGRMHPTPSPTWNSYTGQKGRSYNLDSVEKPPICQAGRGRKPHFGHISTLIVPRRRADDPPLRFFNGI